MSAEIKSRTEGSKRALRIYASGDAVGACVSGDNGYGSVPVGGDVTVNRADFLAAVEKECDVIIVRRAEWPEVDAGAVRFPTIDARGPGDHIRAVHEWDTATSVRSEATALLALAEYLDAHPPKPPVDEAQVEALATVIRTELLHGAAKDDGTQRVVKAEQVARALVLAGVRMDVTA